MNVRWRPLRLPLALALPLIVTLPAGCGGSDLEVRGAGEVFATFQAAMRAGDVGRCRELLTSESRGALAEVPWEQVAALAPLRVLGARREHPDRSTYLIDVEDPNEGDARGQYVVVREHGRLVVDLVASAGRNAVAVEATGPRPEYEPRELTPADHERIRRYELSQPREQQPPR